MCKRCAICAYLYISRASMMRLTVVNVFYSGRVGTMPRRLCIYFILFFLIFAHTPSANGDERRAESHLRDMVRVSITVVNLLKLTRLAVLYVWRWSAVEDHEGCVQYRQIYHFNTADSWITKYFPFLSLHQKGPRLRKNKTFNIRSSQ